MNRKVKKYIKDQYRLLYPNLSNENCEEGFEDLKKEIDFNTSGYASIMEKKQNKIKILVSTIVAYSIVTAIIITTYAFEHHNHVKLQKNLYSQSLIAAEKYFDNEFGLTMINPVMTALDREALINCFFVDTGRFDDFYCQLYLQNNLEDDNIYSLIFETGNEQVVIQSIESSTIQKIGFDEPILGLLTVSCYKEDTLFLSCSYNVEEQ